MLKNYNHYIQDTIQNLQNATITNILFNITILQYKFIQYRFLSSFGTWPQDSIVFNSNVTPDGLKVENKNNESIAVRQYCYSSCNPSLCQQTFFFYFFCHYKTAVNKQQHFKGLKQTGIHSGMTCPVIVKRSWCVAFIRGDTLFYSFHRRPRFSMTSEVDQRGGGLVT